ncbi:hypothetical protein MKX01_004506 [Papaver californicum]|nr:hypothetical protein MKX01_004506 [Papaver californicum]
MDVFMSKRKMQPAVVLALFLLVGFNIVVNISSVCGSMDIHEHHIELNYNGMNNVAARKLLRTMSKPPAPQANQQKLWINPPGPPQNI